MILILVLSVSTSVLAQGYPEVATPGPPSPPPVSTTRTTGAPDPTEPPITTTKAPPPPPLDCQSDVLFVLDSTGSVKDDFARQLAFMAGVVEGMTIGQDAQVVGIVEYSSDLRQQIVIPIGQHGDKQELLDQIAALPHYSGITATGAALSLALEALEQRRAGLATTVVVLTDGFSYDYVEEPAAALRAEPDVRVFAVGVVSPVDEDELLLIAGDAERVFIGAESMNDVQQAIGVCAREPTEPPPPSTTTTTTAAPSTAATQPESEAPKTETVETQPSTAATQTTSGSTAAATTATTTPEPTTTTTKASGCLLDVLIVLDASGSVEATFREELQIASDLVRRLSVGERQAKVALIRFAGPQKAKTIFNFDTYTSRDDILAAIDEVVWISGTTDVAGALVLAEKEFSNARGARLLDADPVIVVFTDGYSQTDPKEAAAALHDRGLTVYAVGVPRNYPVNRADLVVIAGDPARVYIEAEAFYDEIDTLVQTC